MLSTILIYKTDNLSIESIVYVPGKVDKNRTWEASYNGTLTLRLTIMVNGKMQSVTILSNSPMRLSPEKEFAIPKSIREDEEACKKEMIKLLPTWEQIDVCDSDCLKVRLVYDGSEKFSNYLKTLSDLGYKMGFGIFARLDQHIMSTYKQAIDENA
jgi:hypothetical protein